MMAHGYERGRNETGETLDDLEATLQEALNETDSTDASYQIRSALQKVEVLRWSDDGADSQGRL